MKEFILGDLHGNATGELNSLSNNHWPEGKTLTKEDIVFQLGDFGFYFAYPEYKELYKKLYNQREILANKEYTILIIPGNHENYDLIESLPQIEKWGGIVYEEKFEEGSLYIAKRGEIYNINGKTFFTFGGALSSDKDDRHSIDELGTEKRVKKYRYGELIGVRMKKIKIGSINYWKRELPSEEEMEYGLQNLSLHNYEVDYILTHTCPSSIIDSFLNKTDENEAKFNCPTGDYLEKIYKKTKFKHWYFGHLHTNKTLDTKEGSFTCHYHKKPKIIE